MREVNITMKTELALLDVLIHAGKLGEVTGITSYNVTDLERVVQPAAKAPDSVTTEQVQDAVAAVKAPETLGDIMGASESAVKLASEKGVDLQSVTPANGKSITKIDVQRYLKSQALNGAGLAVAPASNPNFKADVPTVDDVRNKLRELLDKGQPGEDVAVAIMGELGAANVSGLTEAQYPAFITAADAALNG